MTATPSVSSAITGRMADPARRMRFFAAALLLRIAQIEAGARREKFAPVDLAALLGDVGDVYVEVAEDAGQTMLCDVAGPA